MRKTSHTKGGLYVDSQKVEIDQKWDGLKGYLTNPKMTMYEVLKNYGHLWQIEKAFRVAKNELKIRPVFHYKKERIAAHICLNFTALQSLQRTGKSSKREKYRNKSREGNRDHSKYS
jgi:transposase